MKKNRIRLGVNLDHIAFIKKSRDTLYPNLIDAVQIAEDAGADLITIHLREDRRHIQDLDAKQIRDHAKILNYQLLLLFDIAHQIYAYKKYLNNQTVCKI